MKIQGLGHTAYMVRDMEKALHFYCDILGFKKIFTLETDAGEPWIIYLEIAPKHYIELFYAKADTQDVQLGRDNMGKRIGYMHLCLEVTGMPELEEHLRANGVEILSPTHMGIDDTWQMWIEDPDGNPIEFHEYTDKSYQLVGKP